ncbi:hypothetical protein I553_9175, partial [Mycobacterium xenopi 4042]
MRLVTGSRSTIGRNAVRHWRGVAGRAIDDPRHHPGELRIIINRGDVLAQPIALPMPTRVTTVNL